MRTTMIRRQWALAAVVMCSLCAATRTTRGEEGTRKIDIAHSKMIVRVSKSGLFSPFAHNHEIEAPIESGEVNDQRTVSDSAATASASGESAELRVDARRLRVMDPETSTETRAKIQGTMLGPDVLDAERYPEIHFRSTTVESKGRNSWRVQGVLDLHGQRHPIAVDVELKDGVYRGTAALKQTEFGIKPVSIAGGTVNVKDEVRIEFEIALTR